MTSSSGTTERSKTNGLTDEALYNWSGVTREQLTSVFGENAGKVIDAIDKNIDKTIYSTVAGLVCLGVNYAAGGTTTVLGTAFGIAAGAAMLKGAYHLIQPRNIGRTAKYALGLK